MSQTLRMRLTADQVKIDAMVAELRGLPQVERAAESADLTSHMHDDSSSAQLPDDQGPGTHYVELAIADEADLDRVRELVALAASSRDIALEILEGRPGA